MCFFETFPQIACQVFFLLNSGSPYTAFNASLLVIGFGTSIYKIFKAPLGSPSYMLGVGTFLSFATPWVYINLIMWPFDPRPKWVQD